MTELFGSISQILLIFQIVTFLSAGIALAAEDAPDTTKPQRWGRAYVNTLLLAAGVATILNIAVRLI